MRSRLSPGARQRWLLFLLSLAVATALWFSVNDASRQVVLPGRAGSVLRTVPVIPTVAGAPAEGFAVRAVEVQPPVVTLTGPQGILEVIETIYTTEVDIFAARTDVTRTVDLRLPPLVRATGPVTVNVRIGAATARRMVDNTRVVLEGLPDGLQGAAQPAEVSVEIEGPPSLVASLASTDLRAVVNAGELGPGPHRVRPQVQAPAGVRIVAVRPAEVVITVRRLYP